MGQWVQCRTKGDYKVSVSALSDHLMGQYESKQLDEQKKVSVSALSDHLMGQSMNPNS